MQSFYARRSQSAKKCSQVISPFMLLGSLHLKALFKMLVKLTPAGVNLINVLAAFFKPACVLFFSGAYFGSYKKFKRLNFLPEAQKSLKP